MSAEIVPPTRRRCERCGRTDAWDDATDNWTIVEEDGERLAGDKHCIHEWDINGQYNPVAEAGAETDG
jgi:hypothetical protein